MLNSSFVETDMKQFCAYVATSLTQNLFDDNFCHNMCHRNSWYHDKLPGPRQVLWEVKWVFLSTNKAHILIIILLGTRSRFFFLIYHLYNKTIDSAIFTYISYNIYMLSTVSPKSPIHLYRCGSFRLLRYRDHKQAVDKGSSRVLLLVTAPLYNEYLPITTLVSFQKWRLSVQFNLCPTTPSLKQANFLYPIKVVQ